MTEPTPSIPADASAVASADDAAMIAERQVVAKRPPPPPPPGYRGIDNVNKTSCHTSSALQLLFHCFPVLREALLGLARTSADYRVRHPKKGGRRRDSWRDGAGGGGGGEDDGDMIQREFVYQLSWFFHLLAYDEDVVAVSREAAKKAEEEAKRDAAIARARREEEENATVTSQRSEFRMMLDVAAAKPRKEPPSPGESRRSRRSRHGSRHSSRQSSSHRQSGTSRRGNRHGRHDKESRRATLLRMRDVNPIQRAAIDAFMEKARKGESTEEDWKRLVQVMRDDNRAQYREALKVTMGRHAGEGGVGEEMVGRKIDEEVNKIDNIVARGGGGKYGDRKTGTEEVHAGLEATARRGERRGSEGGVREGFSFGAGGEEEAQIKPSDGILGGGRPEDTNDSDPTARKTAAGNDSVDPTSFYAHLTSYTANATLESRYHAASMYVDTSNVGDAANVFRCLVNALEYSTSNEVERLEKVLDILEIETWNEEGKEADHGDGGKRGKGSEDAGERELKSSLEGVRDSARYEWSGVLLSRIVGTRTAVDHDGDNPMLPASAAITTTTTVRRTKKNGNIERPVPVPFPLPVIQQPCQNRRSEVLTKSAQRQRMLEDASQSTQSSGESDGEEEGRHYFPSLTESLHSVTIDPNPIRGYDWRGLMKRKEVVEETFVTRSDAEGKEVEEEEKEGYDEDLAATKMEEDVMLTHMPSAESDDGARDAVTERRLAEADDGAKKSSTDDASKSIEGDIDESKEADSVKSAELANSTGQQTEKAPRARNALASVAILDASNDDGSVSVISETDAVRVVACQADFGFDMGTQATFDEINEPIESLEARYKTIEVSADRAGEKPKEEEAEKEEAEEEGKADEEEGKKGEDAKDGASVTSEKSARSSKFAIEKDACYAAAVAAIARSAQAKGAASASRGRGTSAADDSRGDRSRSPSLESIRSRHSVRNRGTSTDARGRRDRGTSTGRAGGAAADGRRRVRDPSADSPGRAGGRARGASSVNSRSRRDASVDSAKPAARDDASVQSQRSLFDQILGTMVLAPPASKVPRDDASVGSQRSFFDRILGTEVRAPGAAHASPTAKAYGGDGDGGNNVVSYVTSPNLFAKLPGITTPSGMFVGPSPDEPAPTPQEEQAPLAEQMRTTVLSYSSQLSKKFLLQSDDEEDDDGDSSSSSSDCSSSSEDTSVDSHVSSVDTDTTSDDEAGRGGGDDDSSMTHSSAIETPPDIDQIFDELSFTDDSASSNADEKKEDDDALRAAAPDAPDNANSDPVVAEEARTPKAGSAQAAVVPPSPKVEVDHNLDSSSYSAMSDSNDNDDDSSSSSSGSSSDGSSSPSSSGSTSSTDSSSSTTDSSSSSSTSSSSSAEHFHADGVAVAAVPVEGNDGNGGEREGENKSQVHRSHRSAQRREEWITRKETRFVPRADGLPRSLVFHLKRFEYSPRLGRTEKLPGRFDVPEVLDLGEFCLESPKEGATAGGGGEEGAGRHRYRLTGAIVHVDPVEEEGDAVYGEASEGHYVTFVRSAAAESTPDAPQDKEEGAAAWIEVDDEVARIVPDLAAGTDDGTETTASPSTESGAPGNAAEGAERRGRRHPALDVLGGAACEGRERRYATLVVYSRCEGR